LDICFFILFFAICLLCHAQVRKDTRLAPLFHTVSDEKLGGAWEHSYQVALDDQKTNRTFI